MLARRADCAWTGTDPPIRQSMRGTARRRALPQNGMPMTDAPKVAVVWRGDRATRQAATPQNNRYHRVFDELNRAGIGAEPAVFDEAFADEVRDQLLGVDGVLVWVNPLDAGRTRAVLDALLRDVAARGPWVSAHPDVILK